MAQYPIPNGTFLMEDIQSDTQYLKQAIKAHKEEILSFRSLIYQDRSKAYKEIIDTNDFVLARDA